jgi:hypothetical protein
MKAYVLIILVLTFSLTGFANNPKYPENLNKEYVDMFESEFLMEMKSTNLIIDIERKFVSLFDEVSQVNAQYSETNGHYYLVFGQQNGEEKIELLKIDRKDMINSTYTYIDFDGISNLDSVEYCYTGTSPNNGKNCPSSSECINEFRSSTPCAVMICGVWNGFFCFNQ